MKSKAQQAFERMRDEKAASLHPEQAALVAMRQIVRDAGNGELDLKDVIEIVIAEECRCGATMEAATLTAKQLSEGKICDFAKRNLGARTRRRHYCQAKPDPYWEAEMERRSAELSAMANARPNNGGGR